jgi:hypothetical protein
VDGKGTQRLLDLLFYRYEAGGTSLFAVLDGARDPRVAKALAESGLEQQCLFSGQLAPALRAASPTLVRLLPDSIVCERLIAQSYGQAWGVFLASPAGLREVRRHLRTLLRVQTETGRRLFFRYYDPRVLRVFLPTCDGTQLRQVFGPIQRFDAEAADGASLLRFRALTERDGTTTLRSWRYALSEREDAVDDHGAC